MKKLALFLLGILCFLSCTTRNDLRREEAVENLRQEVAATRGEKADIESISLQLRDDVGRLRNLIEQNHEQFRVQNDELRKEMATLTGRIQALEHRAVVQEEEPQETTPVLHAFTFGSGKKLFDEGKFDEALGVFREVSKGKSKPEDIKRSQFFIGESLFSAKDYASAILEFAEFKKNYPKDPLLPNAIYRQANALKLMGKGKEARLFYTELMDKFPKHHLAAKSKQETRKLK